jgi:hypothetical protein
MNEKTQAKLIDSMNKTTTNEDSVLLTYKELKEENNETQTISEDHIVNRSSDPRSRVYQLRSGRTATTLDNGEQ